MLFNQRFIDMFTVASGNQRVSESILLYPFSMNLLEVVLCSNFW